MKIACKRIYDAPADTDGKRVLVDRLWPRGIKKENAQVDWWAKTLTPSNELRKWYHEDMENRWVEFQQRYRAELSLVPTDLEMLRQDAEQQVTLLTAVKVPEHSHVTVLIDVLSGK